MAVRATGTCASCGAGREGQRHSHVEWLVKAERSGRLALRGRIKDRSSRERAYVSGSLALPVTQPAPIIN
jgi:uncharacterized protein YciI